MCKYLVLSSYNRKWARKSYQGLPSSQIKSEAKNSQSFEPKKYIHLIIINFRWVHLCVIRLSIL